MSNMFEKVTTGPKVNLNSINVYFVTIQTEARMKCVATRQERMNNQTKHCPQTPASFPGGSAFLGKAGTAKEADMQTGWKSWAAHKSA